MIMRQCIHCKNVYPLKNEYFYKIEKKRLSTKCIDCQKKYEQKYKNSLPDAYIKKCLRMPDASPEIIELKRLQIKLKRAIKSCKST